MPESAEVLGKTPMGKTLFHKTSPGTAAAELPPAVKPPTGMPTCTSMTTTLSNVGSQKSQSSFVLSLQKCDIKGQLHQTWPR